jgi:AraC-like DNA-binding protein
MKDPSISLMSVMLLLGSAQGLFLFLALLRIRKGNLLANKWLASLLFTFSLSLIDGFMTETNYFLRYPYLIGIEWPTNFAYGPLIYLYVRSLIEMGPPTSRWRQLAHFIPVIALYIYLIPFFSLNTEQKVLWWMLSNNSTTANPAYEIDPIIVLIVVQLAVYLLVSLRLLAKQSSRIKDNFSAVEAISLSWLRNLLIAFFILWAMYAFTFIFSGFFGVYHEAEYFIHLTLASVIYVMGFKGLAQPEIFSMLRSISPTEKIELTFPPERKRDLQNSEPLGDMLIKQEGKYKKSSLTNEQAELILAQLFEFMEKEKPYLEMGLTLAVLAGKLFVSSNHLSQVINEKLNKSFFDFVNGYRVEEAKRLLVSPLSSRLSILGIGMEAGFSSKSAFYTSFKKLTGMTPSKFKVQGLDSGDTIR